MQLNQLRVTHRFLSSAVQPNFFPTPNFSRDRLNSSFSIVQFTISSSLCMNHKIISKPAFSSLSGAPIFNHLPFAVQNLFHAQHFIIKLSTTTLCSVPPSPSPLGSRSPVILLGYEFLCTHPTDSRTSSNTLFNLFSFVPVSIYTSVQWSLHQKPHQVHLLPSVLISLESFSINLHAPFTVRDTHFSFHPSIS